jgi:hypothetical protein
MKTDAFTHIVAKRDHETLGRVRTEPSDAKHGFRNLSQDPVVQLITINSEPGTSLPENTQGDNSRRDVARAVAR